MKERDFPALFLCHIKINLQFMRILLGGIEKAVAKYEFK